MTPHALRAARVALGLSAEALGRVVAVSGRTVRRWEAGDRKILGPEAVLLDLILHVPAAREWLRLAASGR